MRVPGSRDGREQGASRVREVSWPKGSVRDVGLGERHWGDVARAKGLVVVDLPCGICKGNMFSEKRKKNVTRSDPCAFELVRKRSERDAKEKRISR